VRQPFRDTELQERPSGTGRLPLLFQNRLELRSGQVQRDQRVCGRLDGRRLPAAHAAVGVAPPARFVRPVCRAPAAGPMRPVAPPPRFSLPLLWRARLKPAVMSPTLTAPSTSASFLASSTMACTSSIAG